MIKSNLIMTLALAILCNIGANAQTKIWGVGAPTGQAAAQFQNPFVTSSSTTAWEARSINHSNGAVAPGNALWVRTTNGQSQGAFGSVDITGLPNCSFANGAALFDSDFLDNAGGGQAAIGTGTAPAPHQGQLISPRIDLTGYTNQALALKFNCAWINFQANVTVSMSTDDGSNWTDVDLQTVLPTAANNASQGYVSVPFYTLTQNVNLLNQCRIRFIFDGDYYGIHIDDLVLETAPKYDMAIRSADPTSNNLGGAFSIAKAGNNRFIPCGIMDLNDLREWVWGLSAINNGTTDILPPSNPKAYMSIDYVGPNAPASNVYLDTIEFDTILADLATNVTLTDDFRDINFAQVHKAGDYRVTYWLSHDSTDANPDNDTIRYVFTLTDNSGPFANYLSKARLSANDGRVFASRPIFPGGTTFSDFEYGSMFYFPRGGTDSVNIDSIVFRYYVPNGFTGAANQTALVNVHRFDETMNGANCDGAIDDSGADLAYIGAGIVPLTGLGTTIANGSYGLGIADNIINPASSNGDPMDNFINGGFYVISVQNTINLPTGPTTPFNSNSTFWLGVDEYNYAINAALTDCGDIMPIPSPAKIVDAAGVGDWNWVGFGADMVPSIGIHLNITRLGPHTNTATVEDADAATFSVYPNPTADVVTIELELEEAEDVTYILTDVSGRVLTMSRAEQISTANHTMNMQSFPAGVYFLIAKTAEKDYTQRIIKQ